MTLKDIATNLLIHLFILCIIKYVLYANFAIFYILKLILPCKLNHLVSKRWLLPYSKVCVFFFPLKVLHIEFHLVIFIVSYRKKRVFLFNFIQKFTNFGINISVQRKCGEREKCKFWMMLKVINIFFSRVHRPLHSLKCLFFHWNKVGVFLT